MYVEPTPWQTNRLEKIKTEFELQYSDGRVAVMTRWVMVQLMKMRQICAGFYITDEKTVVKGSSAKYKLLIELLQGELKGHKVVIWCNFRREIRLVTDTLTSKAIGYVTYHGGTSLQERKLNVRAFQTDSKIQCFVGQIAAGGQAITLTAADRAIYMSNPYSYRDRAQSEKRTHRIGSEKHERVHYIDIITRGTIEKQMHTALTIKQWKNDLVMQRHLLRRILKGAIKVRS